MSTLDEESMFLYKAMTFNQLVQICGTLQNNMSHEKVTFLTSLPNWYLETWLLPAH